ncbi:hypothetical protein GCM10010082_31730 [Kushneria pakistanensis]|uniref:Baseplate assembly protein n=1 Tax=Kushneria pakistanensis TaxID=1508770 RepID=A0ABQ3FQY5_9GAMM|nr:hypothetical protein [Kushneria pakistanensis]GHC34678.1 hypothetical protein GCM10010082_31730 [Kushneria pakistanensis]
MKQGMCRVTGALISGVPYLRQRLEDVINTPIGSLVGRRDFGSRMHEIQDRNVNEAFHMDAYIRLAEAISDPANGLDDFRLQNLQLSQPESNQVELAVSGLLLIDGQPRSITTDDTHGIMWNGRN